MTTYDGLGGTDSLTIVLTPRQFDYLTDAQITALKNYLANPTGQTLTLSIDVPNDGVVDTLDELSLSITVVNFETANIAVYDDSTTTEITSCFNNVASSQNVIVGSNDPSVVDNIQGDSNVADLIFGQSGDDSIVAGAVADCIFGGAGNDTITPVSTTYAVLKYWGGSGNDYLQGSFGQSILRGGPGNDTLDSGGGSEYLYGDEGDDTLIGNLGGDHLFGGPGSDTITSGLDRDNIYTDATDDGFDTVTDFALYSDYLNFRYSSCSTSNVTTSVNSTLKTTAVFYASVQRFLLRNWSRANLGSQRVCQAP